MKHKRLNRDGWGFQYYPYYQMRVDCDEFHGLVCLIRLTDGEENYWSMPAGRIQVTGAGMTWMQLIPDHQNRVITVKYYPDGTHDPQRKFYPAPADKRYQPSVWYVDVTEGIEYDEYGIAVYIDKYLDVIFNPEGNIKVDDRDELEEALIAGDITKAQYDSAVEESEAILRDLCNDIPSTDAWCARIREIVERRISSGEAIKPCKEILQRNQNADNLTVNATIAYIRELFKDNAGGHDADHSLRVYHNALLIAEDEPECDTYLVALAALLHDADDRTVFAGAKPNNGNTRELLSGQQVGHERIEQICQIINSLSAAVSPGGRPMVLEAKIVKDADRLDAMGAIGIARTFAYGGEQGRSLDGSVESFENRLLRLKDKLYTQRAKEMGQTRHAFIEQFLQEYRREMRA